MHPRACARECNHRPEAAIPAGNFRGCLTAFEAHIWVRWRCPQETALDADFVNMNLCSSAGAEQVKFHRRFFHCMGGVFAGV
eukprot:5705021-Pleurochrysis_carterae.AAC.4